MDKLGYFWPFWNMCLLKLREGQCVKSCMQIWVRCFVEASLLPHITLSWKSNFCPKIQFWQIFIQRNICIFAPKIFIFKIKFFAKKLFFQVEFMVKNWRFGIVCTLLLSTTNKIVFAWASCPWSWTVPCPLSFKIVDNNFYIAFSRWVLQVLMAHHLIAKL